MPSPINSAILQLVRRAEGNDTEDLINTFVSVGPLMDLLRSVDHQIVYGRRGTGKTHVLQYLSEVATSAGDISVYVDLRTVGSNGGIYGDPAIPLTERATRLLVDVLTHTYNALAAQLLDAAYGGEFETADALRQLDALERSITDVRVSGDEAVTLVRARGEETQEGSQIGLSPRSAELRIASSRSGSERMERTESVQGPRRYNVHFGAVAGALAALAGALPGGCG